MITIQNKSSPAWAFVVAAAFNGLVLLLCSPLASASSFQNLLLWISMAFSAVLLWLYCVGSYRRVCIDEEKAEVVVRSANLRMRKQERRYPLSAFQSIYSYRTLSQLPKSRLVLYSRDQRELWLQDYDLRSTVRWKAGFSEPEEVAALRLQIASLTGLKDAGFFTYANGLPRNFEKL